MSLPTNVLRSGILISALGFSGIPRTTTKNWIHYNFTYKNNSLKRTSESMSNFPVTNQRLELLLTLFCLGK
jgi:hypothetical protein